MKTNKNFKFYTIIWFCAVILFNVITFAVPDEIAGYNRFDQDLFWLGYGFITLSFVVQLICSFFCFKDDDKKKIFLRLPLLRISIILLIPSIITGLLFMIFSFLSMWIGIIICAVLMFCYIIAASMAAVAISSVENVEKKVAEKTEFIRLIVSDADSLIAYAKTEELKITVKKVYEALRYSDPMSAEGLLSIESEIQNSFSVFSAAIKENKAEAAVPEAEKLLLLINDRNKKCKVLKV